MVNVEGDGELEGMMTWKDRVYKGLNQKRPGSGSGSELEDVDAEV